MAKIHFMSDIHLEFGNLLYPTEGDYLVLAGDITVRAKYLETILLWSKGFKHTFYVCGNHEFYNDSIERVYKEMRKFFEGTTVHVLENEVFLGEELTLVGCTLWTNLNKRDPYAVMAAERGMNDFRIITSDRKRFRAIDSYQRHVDSMRFLEAHVTSPETIVVTHHAPSVHSTLSRYRGSAINPCFFSNLEEFILRKKPKLWIHGHCHNSSDYMIGDTRVVNNPRGYVGMSDLNPEFDDNRYVEV